MLLSTPFVADLIAKGEIAAIREAMKLGSDGMQTFDQSLYDLYAAGEISYGEAMDNADSRTDLALRVRLRGPAPEGGEVDAMQLEEMPAAANPAGRGRFLTRHGP